MYKILIVEDDRVIANKMKEHLEKWDYEVACVQDFKRVQEEYTAFDPQLVIMDIILPFYNGFHWCTQIRQISSVPILFLSSANDNMNIVMAMNMGGDDFVEKPFDLNVLTAKIQALLRRAYSFTGQLNVLEYRDVILNLNDAAVTFHGERMELTKVEKE
jgi:DNA-binding response OmpR family regulator